ncbi:hypothetical protein [Haloarchaeobius sp. DFWS5]|uniref:hypothetical protein n=1 Tax=Haloarchaeobius sp. DFWS5 TaxID=3446114 RepID=UPI003EB9261F
MSRTGPEYVESEAEMERDLERKQEAGTISAQTAADFKELYEFAEGLGDDVFIGEAKNANFRVFVDAHHAGYPGTPSVFSANVTGDVKIWPAGRPVRDDADASLVEWDQQEYATLRRKFQDLQGVPPGDLEVSFETICNGDNFDEFKEMITEFVAACRESAAKSSQSQ